MKYLINILFCSMLLVTSYGQSAFSLQEAIEYGFKNHNSMKQNAIDVERAEQNIRSYYATGLPKLSADVEFNHFLEIPTSFLPGEVFGGQPGTYNKVKFGLPNSLKAGATLSTLIFDGAYFTGIKAQKLYRELQKKKLNQTKYDLEKSITKAYMNVLMAQENIEIFDNNIANLKKSMEETQALFENGFVEKLDVDRLELSYDLLVSKKKSIMRMIELSKNLLKFQMNFPLGEEITLVQSLDDIVDKVIVADVQEKKTDYSKRPEFEQLRLLQELNQVNLRATKNQRYPRLVGFANYQQQLQRKDVFDNDEPGFTPTSIVGLKLEIPIYSGGDLSTKIQKVKLDIEQANLQQQDFERVVDLQVFNAYQNYLNAKESMFAAKRQQRLAEDIFDITKKKYKEGVGSSIETSAAERETYTAQQQYIQSLFDLVMSKIELDIARGELSSNQY